MIEIWKPIDGYKNYEVSNYGRVRSLMFNRSKILKKRNIHHGYCGVVLYKDKKPKAFTIHKLVAQAFIPNPDNLPSINHKDENKANNCVDNLEWCTILYNNTYNNRHLKAGKKHTKKVNQYTLDGEFVKEWPSIVAIQEELGFQKTSISQCCRNVRKKAHNFKWQFVNNQIIEPNKKIC